jgi:hypothetical protein
MSVRVRTARLGRWVGLIAIALLAIVATAQADGEWKISEKTMTELEAPEASVYVTSTSETFKLAVAWYASELECSTLATEAPTKIFPEGTSEAILKLSSCQVLGPPFVAETCETTEPVELKVAGKLLLHESKTYELFKAQSGKTSLGTVKFKEGTECPLPLSNELKGSFVGETEAGERVEQPLTFNSTVESQFESDSLSFGTHPATLKGKSLWAMAAGYKGLKWAAEGKEPPCKRESSEAGWYVCGAKVTSKLAIKAQATSDTKIELLTTSGGAEVGISCEKVEITSAELEAGGKANGTAKVTGCSTFLNGKLSELCKPIEPIEMSGTAEIVKHEGTTYIKATGASGVFTTLTFVDSEECSLPEEVSLTGTIWIEDCEAQLETEALVHLLQEGKAPAEALGGVKFGKNAATIDGSLSVEVIHEGEMLQFSALG